MHLVEHIDDLSESRGALSLNDGIHDDLTNASLDNRDNSLLHEINTNGSESDRSTHHGQPIQGINDVPMKKKKKGRTYFRDLDGFLTIQEGIWLRKWICLLVLNGKQITSNQFM